MKRLFFALVFMALLTLPAYAVPETETADGKIPPALSGVDAGAYILMEMDSGRVLAGERIHERLPMASTTKIMTALLALEQPDTDEYFTVDGKAILVEGSSMGLLPGDRITLRGLAAGMLLHSGNDSAGAAAVKIGGTVEGFVEMMNRRAQEMGLADTHFDTPSGLDGESHYSSAYDMAILAKNALSNGDFLAICSQERMQVSFGNPPYDRWLKNHNKLLSSYEGCIGVKTGFTKKAGRCLVSAARRDGVTLICVTLRAADDWNVHKMLLDHGFATLKQVELSAYLPDILLPVTGGMAPSVGIKLEAGAAAAILEGEERQITAKVYLEPFVYAPLPVGQKVGEAQFYLGDTSLGRWSLFPTAAVAQRPVEKRGFWQNAARWFRSFGGGG